MVELSELIIEQIHWIVIGLVGIVFLLLIWNLVQGSKLKKMRRKYELMMKSSGVDNLEELLIDLRSQLELQSEEQGKQKQSLESLLNRLPKKKANIGMKRYKAFAEHGSDLSFSVAWVDDEKNGVVITGIYNRDGSYVYAKPLVKGESSYTLSPEEKEAIAHAIQEG